MAAQSSFILTTVQPLSKHGCALVLGHPCKFLFYPPLQPPALTEEANFDGLSEITQRNPV